MSKMLFFSKINLGILMCACLIAIINKVVKLITKRKCQWCCVSEEYYKSFQNEHW